MNYLGILAVIVLSTSLARGDYGDKVKSNNTSSSLSSENFGSSEEYYDDSSEDKPTVTPEKPLTTPDDGVVIEKAILAAEITPKASYSLIDNPIRYDESFDNSYTQAKFGSQKEFFGYSSSDITTSKEEGSTLSPTKYSGNNEIFGNSLYKTPLSKSSPDTMQNLPQTHSGYQFPSWSFLGMYNIPSLVTQKPFSATYKRDNDFETKTAIVPDIKSNEIGISEDGSYDPVANGDFHHLGFKSSSQQHWPYSGFNPEIAAQLEQERQSQIQATQLYLKQIESAQEYSTKVQALQDALYSSFQSSEPNFSSWPYSKVHETYDASTTPETPLTLRPKIVPKTDAPGVNVFGQQNTHHSQPTYSLQAQTTANQVNSLAGGEWMLPVVATTSPFGFVMYTGPTASPVVLPSGFLADTEEVMQARIAHLQALMNAIESTSAWKNQKSDRWS